MLEEKCIAIGSGILHYWKNQFIENRKNLFFLHGAGVDHQMFDSQVKYFFENYNLILWDARWHGKSKEGFVTFSIDALTDDVIKVMKNENLEKCIFIGQSMGGNIAQEIDLKYPEFVDKIVVIDSTKNLQKLSAFEKLLIKISKPMLEKYSLEKLAQISGKACSIRGDVQNYVIDCFLNLGKEKFLSVFFELYNFIHEESNYTYSHDILLICGDKDRTGNIKKIMKKWSKTLPGKYFCIKNAAHNSNQDQPEKVNNIIESFINGKT